MPTPAAAAALASSSSFIATNHQPNLPSFPLIRAAARIPTAATRQRSKSIKISCQAAVAADVSSPSSSSSSVSDEVLQAESKVGKRIRVKVPLKVYHVNKAPDLDLNGMIGVIKQFVGFWKGKRISANLPFKVEFLVELEGQPNPLKFFAHLKEDEFDLLEDL